MWILAAASDVAVPPPAGAAPAAAPVPLPDALLSPQPARRPVAAAPAARATLPVSIALRPEFGSDVSAAGSIDLLLSSLTFVSPLGIGSMQRGSLTGIGCCGLVAVCRQHRQRH